MKAVGLLVAVGSLIAGIVLVALGVVQPAATIDNYARANLGCTTELKVDAGGEYWVYVERYSEAVAGLGDCSPRYDGGADVSVTISGPDGEVVLDDSVSKSYSRDGREARSLGRLSLDEPGTYELVASGSDEQTVVAIGPHPDSGRMTFIAVGVATALVGLGVGLVILMRGKRQVTAAPDEDASDTAPMPAAPPVPPAAPADPSVWAPRAVDWSAPDPSTRYD